MTEVLAIPNLTGLRDLLLTPQAAMRDQHGWLSHLYMPVCDEDVSYKGLLSAFGIETTFISMESDDPDMYEAYSESESNDCSAWTPTVPEGPDWILLEIFDTEDGPMALFGRQQRKKIEQRAWPTTREQDAAYLIRRLARRLQKVAPDDSLAGDALDALRRWGVLSSVTRGGEEDAS
jgi:hypothetical protein